jgi:hypothetical protein
MSRRRALVLAVIALACVWGTAQCGFLSMLGLIVCLAATLQLSRAKQGLAAGAILVLSPCSPHAVRGAADYARGEFVLLGVGLYDDEVYFRVDPIWRCGQRSLGCMVDGDEWVRILPYNLAGKALITLLGPMPRSYVGPYPEWDEVEAALDGAAVVPVADFRSDRVILPGRKPILLPSGCGDKYLESVTLAWTSEPETSKFCFDPPRAAVVEGALALRVPSCFREERAMTALVDPESGLLVAARHVRLGDLHGCTWLHHSRRR